jgi:hypothetical protein
MARKMIYLQTKLQKDKKGWHSLTENLKKKFYEESLLEILRQNKKKQKDDQETNFTLSLVPMLKALPIDKKIDAQIQILQIFKNLNSPPTPTNPQPGPSGTQFTPGLLSISHCSVPLPVRNVSQNVRPFSIHLVSHLFLYRPLLPTLLTTMPLHILNA